MVLPTAFTQITQHHALVLQGINLQDPASILRDAINTAIGGLQPPVPLLPALERSPKKLDLFGARIHSKHLTHSIEDLLDL